MRGTLLKMFVGGIGGVLVLGMLFSLIPDSKQPEPAPVARDTRSTPERYKDRLDSAQASGDTAQANEFAMRILRDYPSSDEAETLRALRPDLVPTAGEALRREKEVQDRARERAERETELAATPQATMHPVAVDLAAIKNGRRVSASDPMVGAINEMLNTLDARYPENPQQIGDMTARAYQILRQEGHSADITQILREMQTAAVDGHGQTYADMLAAYMTLRASGSR